MCGFKLAEKTILANRVEPSIEKAIVDISCVWTRVSNELKKQGILVFSEGVCSI